MAKGKKKGGGKGKEEEPEVLPSMSTLSISDSAPSTSQLETDEASVLTSAAAKRKAKKAAKAAPLEISSQPIRPSGPVPIPEPAPTPVVQAPEPKSEEKPEDDEECGLGLGLSGGKKRPRKKKSATTAAAAATSVAVPAAPSAVPATPSAVPATPSAVPATPAVVPATPAAIRAPPAAVPAPPAAVPATPAVVPATTAAIRATPAAAPFAATPGSATAVASGPPPPWGASAGRGRGQPAASAPQPSPTSFQQPGPPATYSEPQQGPSRPRPQKSLPQPRPTQGVSQQGDSRPASGGKQLCIYTIPKKIEGNSVRCRQIQVLTNYLQMKIAPLKIHRYDVSFTPDRPKKMISPVFAMAKSKCFPKELIAFDQTKNCYSLHALPKVPKTDDRFATQVEFTDQNGRKITFEVSFKFTGIVDLSTITTYMNSGGSSLNPPTEAIQCVDVILRQRTLGSYIKAGRQFFKRPKNPIDLGDGLEMWTGMFQSAIFTTQPFINVDVAHKGFPRQQLLVQALVNDFRLATNMPVEKQRARGVDSFIAFIKGLRVVASVGGDTSKTGQTREFIINGLSAPPSQLKFTLDLEGGVKKTITVADYFAKEKRYRLQYPNLNCVWVGPRDKNIHYPMELLEVAYGHARNRQLNEIQLSTMVRQAATPPDERKRKIEEVIKDMDYSRNKELKQFGLDISDKFFSVNAKVLQPPKLETGSGPVEPRNGSWQANRLLKAETLMRWGFIVIEPDMRSNIDYANIISMIVSCGRGMGMKVDEPVVKHFNVNFRDLKNLLFQCMSESAKFMFIIVPTKGRDYYHKVKQVAEREVGILTQCIKEQTAARRMNVQTIKNILLKVNSKLMGINQALDKTSIPNCLRDGRVMVVGADVTHPSPDQTSVPSIAAVTASIDPKCFIYNIALSIQTPKKEVIVEFEDMMVEHLRLYKERNGALPTKIYVFRDGVSEGQFAQVMNSELLAVHKAYQLLAGPNAKPEVLFLLVQKRHHTRFFLGENNPRNVEPGTVVDQHIVHAAELDFYLVSHQAIKGTARPTRYHAVCNDGNMKHDEVEQLTFYLCHLYSRCMRSVSYPTPTYYAHLACLRARSLTYDEKFDNSRLEKEPKRLRVLDKMLQYSRMFFV